MVNYSIITIKIIIVIRICVNNNLKANHLSNAYLVSNVMPSKGQCRLVVKGTDAGRDRSESWFSH